LSDPCAIDQFIGGEADRYTYIAIMNVRPNVIEIVEGARLLPSRIPNAFKHFLQHRLVIPRLPRSDDIGPESISSEFLLGQRLNIARA